MSVRIPPPYAASVLNANQRFEKWWYDFLKDKDVSSSLTEALSSGKVWIGDVSNLPAEQTISGDATLAVSGALTFATVNANVGSFGSAANVGQFTVNAKGLLTAAANVAIDHGSIAGLADDDHTQYLLASGTRALTADWDAGSFEIRAQTFESDIATGTAPLVIASTTKVVNLNADLLDDQSGAYYLDSANFSGTNWTDLTDGGGTTLHTHSAAALSDYDANTFVPAVSFGGGTTGITYGEQTGTYTKIGNRVFYDIRITLTSNGSSTGTFLITGLPFTSVAGQIYAAAIGYATNLTGVSGGIVGYVNANATTISVYYTATGTATALSDTTVTDTFDIALSGHYRT